MADKKDKKEWQEIARLDLEDWKYLISFSNYAVKQFESRIEQLKRSEDFSQNEIDKVNRELQKALAVREKVKIQARLLLGDFDL